MKKWTSLVLLFLIIWGGATNGYSQSKEPGGTTLTIYHQNIGVVHQQFQMNLAKGLTHIHLSAIPFNLIPSSVILDFDGDVLEQSFENKTVNLGDILKDKYLEKHIRLISKTGSVIEGTLESMNGSQVVLKRTQGDYMIVPDIWSYNISVDHFPVDSVKSPVMTWLVDSHKKGNQVVNLTYQTHGLSWNAEYIGVLNNDENEMKLDAWANLSNHTGHDYQKVHIKLVAGEINVNSNPAFQKFDRAKNAVMAAQAPGSLAERSFADYHIYDLERNVSLDNNESKQIRLFEEKTFPVKKIYICNDHMMGGSGTNKIPVNVQLKFTNAEKEGLGIPLPAGTFNMYRKDGNNLVLLGKDAITSTAEGEKVTLHVGRAFDVDGTEKLADVRKISDRMSEQDFTLSLRNHKDRSILVEVNRYLNSNSIIIKTSSRYEKISANLVRFMINVPAKGNAKLSYTIRSQY